MRVLKSSSMFSVHSVGIPILLGALAGCSAAAGVGDTTASSRSALETAFDQFPNDFGVLGNFSSATGSASLICSVRHQQKNCRARSARAPLRLASTAA